MVRGDGKLVFLKGWVFDVGTVSLTCIGLVPGRWPNFKVGDTAKPTLCFITIASVNLCRTEFSSAETASITLIMAQIVVKSCIKVNSLAKVLFFLNAISPY